MDFSSDILLLPDQFDSVFESDTFCNISENDWEVENEMNNYVDSLIFDETDEETKTYSILNNDVSRKILEQLEEKEKTDTVSEVQNLVHCTHCDDVYSTEFFKMHACMYDQNKELIVMNETSQDDSNENDLEKVQRHSSILLKKNRNMLYKILHGFPTTAGQPTKEEKAKQSNYDCFVCCRKFVHESGLYRHYDKHIGEILKQSEPSRALHSVILCTACGEVFTTDEKSWKHLRENHLQIEDTKFFSTESNSENQEPPKKIKKNVHFCDAGESSTNSVPKEKKPDIQIEDMLRMIYVNKLHHCEFCDSVFSNEKSMLYHTSKHEPLSYFSCQACDLKMLSFKDILIHRHEECWNYRDFRDPLKSIPCVWNCNVCEEEFRGVEQLIMHRHQLFHFFPRIDHRANQLLFVCEFCNTTFENATDLVSHLQEKHLKKLRITQVPETSLRVQKSSSNNRQRGGHHQTSTRPRQYLCEVCGKSYTQSSHLWQHLRFHQGIKNFSCPYDDCDRRFTIRPDLNDHIRKCHTGERPFMCNVCGKRFLTGSVYYQHRLIHRGERRYGCDECGKRFYRADALKNHQRIHSGERPYNCWVCQKGFRQRGDRDKHVKARHKDVETSSSSPKRQKIISFGLGRTRNNVNLYCAKPDIIAADSSDN